MTCTCTEYQLHQVGCDCSHTRDAVVVYVWKDGYASDNKGKIYVDGGEDVGAAVRKAFGSFAAVYQIKRVNDFTSRSLVSTEYARAMSKGDNS